jgi:membrane associated rhomboid family serine protease
MIPLRDENPSVRTPMVTRTIIVLNVIAFIYELMVGPHLRDLFFMWGLVPARITAALAGETNLATAALTTVTSTFLHAGWLHLIGNMWYLWIFGDNVEDRMGHGRFLLFYIVAGLSSGILHIFFNGDSRIPTVGASGAIAGVLGAYLALFPRARVITLVPFIVFFQVMALPAVVVLGLWFVFQFFSGALSLAASTSQSGGTAWWGHIGGFAFGVVFGRLLAMRPPTPSRAWVDGQA